MAQQGYRALITVLTKRMAEDLTEYLHEQGIRVRYMHSDIDTIERIEIIRDLRLGAFDALVGINLLREGLDIPECALVAILDADKEGFLRSETSLVQTIGRAARNIDGRVILYADTITGSMERAMAETVAPAREADRLQHRKRHHAGKRAQGNLRHPRQRLRARPRADRHRHRRRRRGRVRGRRHHRPQFRSGDRRSRNPHAHRRRRPRLRGSRPAARRDQTLARHRAGGDRRPDGEIHLTLPCRGRVGAQRAPGWGRAPAQTRARRNGHRAPPRSRPAPRRRDAARRASRTSTKWARASKSIPGKRDPSGPRSTLGKPGMHGGFKPRRR